MKGSVDVRICKIQINKFTCIYPSFNLSKCIKLHIVSCSDGYYGMACYMQCSKFCKTSHDCHPVSGFCQGGCAIGWQGKHCLEGKLSSKRVSFLIFYLKKNYLFINVSFLLSNSL